MFITDFSRCTATLSSGRTLTAEIYLEIDCYQPPVEVQTEEFAASETEGSGGFSNDPVLS